jgi:thioesterase domain-containing protein
MERAKIIHLAGTERLPKIFCIHATGFSIDYYHTLAIALEDKFAVFGLPPLDDWWHMEGALSKLAKKHADAIQEQQACGPYALLGWSAGGRVALAIAAELESRGEQMAYIGLIDMPVPNKDETLRRSLLRKSAEELNSLNTDRTDEQATPVGVDDDSLERARMVFEKFKKIVASGEIDLYTRLSVEMRLQMLRIIEDRIPRLVSSLHLYWAEGSSNQLDSKSYDWHNITDHSYMISHHAIKADHYSILTAPCVSELATLMISTIAQAHQRSCARPGIEVTM